MSPKRLWVLVEGKTHDRPFYENILEHAALLQGLDYDVRLGEQITVEGKSGGGKSHLLKLYGLFSEQGWLDQSNRRTNVSVVFCLDKDLDDFRCRTVSDPHVVYTQNADVEAEIFHNADIARAISFSHGIGASVAAKIVAGDKPLPERLSGLWSDWIRIRLLAIACNYSASDRFGQPSAVNNENFGSVDTSKVSSMLSAIEKSVSVEEWEEANREVNSFLAALWCSGLRSSLISGKHISEFIVYLTSVISEEFIRSKIKSQEIIISCLARLDFSGSWTEHYHKQLALVLDPDRAPNG